MKWKGQNNKLKENYFEMYEFIHDYLLEENPYKVLLKTMESQLENLSTNFGKYFFTEDIKLCDWNWVINPFESTLTDLSQQAEKQLIDLSSSAEKSNLAI